jgi:CheY-like chemotaxis protein
MQDLIQACLTTFAGWKVRVANSTLEGVPQAILSQPEAIIVEVSVAEIDGLRFFKQLRTPPDTQVIPVAILTYAASWGDLQQSWFQQYHIKFVSIGIVNSS